MSAQIKEALAMLAWVGEHSGINVMYKNGESAGAVIRAALEAAQREAQDWKSIRDWRRQSRALISVKDDSLVIDTDDERFEFGCDSWAESLNMAAVWCREQMAPEHRERQAPSAPNAEEQVKP